MPSHPTLRPTLLRSALAALLWPGLLAAQAPQTLILRTVSQPSIPMKFDLQNLGHPGICIELIRAIEAIDPALKFSGWDQPASLRRIEALLAENQIDAFCALLSSPGRENLFRFVGPPIYRVRHRIAVRTDDPVDVKSFDDIRRLGSDGLILVSKGTKYDEWLRTLGGLQIDNSSSETPVNLRKLLAGRSRLYYFSESALHEAIVAEGLQSKVRLLPAVFMEEPARFVVSRALPQDQVDRIVAALDRLALRGDLERIYAKYKPRF